MKQENHNLRLCFICHRNPVRKICLNDQCIKEEIYLFCDACKRDQRIRKYASQIYEIDAFSNPFCLFSINSHDRQQVEKVQQNAKFCRQSTRENLIKIYDCLPLIEENALENIIQLTETFNSQNAEQIEYFFKNPSQQRKQIFKKVNALKWFKQNKDHIENSKQLSKKITQFSSKFDQRLRQITDTIQRLINTFCDQFDINKVFIEEKKSHKHVSKIKQNVPKNKNTKINKSNPKQFDAKSNDNFTSVQQKTQIKKINQQIKQNASQFLMELQNQKDIQKSQQSSKKINQSQQQKRQQIKKPSQNPNKRRPKPKENRIVQEAIINPPLVLSKIPTKMDYLQNQKMVVNLRSIPSIVWSLHQKHKTASRKQVKQQQFNGVENRQDQSLRFQIQRQSIKEINLQKIKYLQIQQLPKSQKETFNVIIDGQQTEIVYSWVEFQDYFQQMNNLEQIHIFTTLMFLTQQQFLSVLFSCPQLKVISFNCLNPASLVLQTYKNLIQGKFNQELKILQIAGNIPFTENLQFYDLKAYYPENEKNKKIYDQIFVNQSQDWIKSELQDRQLEISKKQDFPHKNSCWFYRQKSGFLQKQRFQTIVTSEQNQYISKSFSQLRNCWIPEIQINSFKQELIKIKKNRNLDKIQHLTLGYHQVKLQAISSDLFSGPEAFLKSLRNLKSLNLVNLTIYELSIRSFFNQQCKQLESLKIEFCLGLKNSFYSNLPKYCPKLRKIAVNNITDQIDGDFIFNLRKLQTIILPWSEIQYKGLANLNGHYQNDHIQNHNIKRDFIEEEGQFERMHFKKWKYINIYGCTWFHTDFFALIDLKEISHLNIGKCSQINIQQLVENLKNCQNLESLCMDELPIENKDLFQTLIHLPKLKRLSVAHCPNLDFRIGKLVPAQVQILDRMTHLDLRNQLKPIDSSYTLKMKNPKYLLISRPFDVEPNQLLILTQRQISVSCSKF